MKSIIYLVFIILFLVGEVKCIVKFFQCDFKESYKAEIIYGVSMATGLGCVVGYMDFGK
jgi:hypothetical protein